MEDAEIQEEKKNWLRRYRKQSENLDRLIEKLNTLDERMTSIRSPSITGMPRGGTPITIDDLVSQKMELENRISRLQEKCRSLRIEILQVIDDLGDSRYCEILEGYFIEKKTFADIGDDMGYNEKSVIRLYRQAISKLSIPDL